MEWKLYFALSFGQADRMDLRYLPAGLYLHAIGVRAAR